MLGIKLSNRSKTVLEVRRVAHLTFDADSQRFESKFRSKRLAILPYWSCARAFCSAKILRTFHHTLLCHAALKDWTFHPLSEFATPFIGTISGMMLFIMRGGLIRPIGGFVATVKEREGGEPPDIMSATFSSFLPPPSCPHLDLIYPL